MVMVMSYLIKQVALRQPVCLCRQAVAYNLAPAKRVNSLAKNVTSSLVKVTAAYHRVYD